MINLQVFSTPETLSEAAAQFIIELAQKAVAERGRFVLALSGGRTPEKLFTLMATESYVKQMPWEKTFIFWGDERCVPLDDDRNNSKMANRLLFKNISIPAANIHVTPVDLLPIDAAGSYEQTLKGFFGKSAPQFDLIMLGLGDNGHTASLFPNTPVIHEQVRWVKEVRVEEQKMYRITMTAPLINQARNILFLVTGDEKAEMVKTIITAPYEPEKYPAQLIKPVAGQLYWFIDKKAAALLS